MRILLINQYAGAPSLGMEFRPHWMAVEWQKLGHEVLIVAGDHSHLRRAQPARGRSHVDAVDFLTLGTPGYTSNGARRFVNILAFRAQLMRASHTLTGWKPDVVIASSTHPMDIRPALRIARGTGALFVHEVHDLWPLTPRLLGGMSERHPMIMWMQREEDLGCREADLMVSMLPATLPYLQSRGLDPERWAHVSNGVPPEAVLAEDPGPPDDGTFRVGYFGAHGPANDLETLIEAARLLREKDVEFHLTGSGPLKAELQQLAAGLPSVRFHEAVSPDEARSRMAEMDALYIGLAPSPLFGHGISPNKMFDYMASGRPIIQAIDTPSSPAELAGCCVRCEPGNASDAAEVITALMRTTSDGRAELGVAGRAYVTTSATYPALAVAFLGELQAVRVR